MTDTPDQAENRGKDPANGRFVEGNGYGRPTAFKPEFLEQARKLFQLGATDHEVADFFEVDRRTLTNWRNTIPEFAEASAVGKAVADDRVEQSLYHKAIGYTYDSEKIFCDKGVVVRASTVEHVPPDTQAATFWLKNRRKELWRDTSQIDHSSSDGSMSPQPPVYQIADK